MPIYTYSEDSGYREQFEAAGDKLAAEHARDLLRTGDWYADGRTLRLHAVITRPDFRSRVTVTLEPDEPACTGDAHDWQDGQPWGSGGGVTYTDTCRACGLNRTVDTWDTCHDCGEPYASLAYSYPPASMVA